MSKQKVLVTGATGFLGKHLIEYLINDGNEIYQTAKSTGDDLSIHSLDLIDANLIKEEIKKIKPSVIYHLGGLVNLSRDFEVAKKCLDINVKGTLNLLDALRGYVPARLIFTSTEEVYGNIQIPYYENYLCFPPSPYAISKVASENLCNFYSQELGFSLIIFRIGTMYGPKDSFSRFIPQIITKALKNEDIPVNSGLKKRDYIYVGDAAKALAIAENVKIINKSETVNIGGGVSYKLIDLVEIILNLTKSKSKILVGKLPERITESSEWLLSNTKAKKILNWGPETPLAGGLKKTIEYYKSNLV